MKKQFVFIVLILLVFSLLWACRISKTETTLSDNSVNKTDSIAFLKVRNTNNPLVQSDTLVKEIRINDNRFLRLTNGKTIPLDHYRYSVSPDGKK